MKEPLFDLIHSLSKSEKRYFKLLVADKQSNKAKKYVLLFDIIESQKEYDEKAAKSKLGKLKENIAYFSADKNYLYQLILKSLRALHAASSVSILVHNYLIEVELLNDKGLPVLAQKQLAKAKKLAKKHELFSLFLEILRWERKIAGIPVDRKRLELEQLHYEEAKKQLTNFFSYEFLYREAMLIRKETSKARSEEATQKFETFIQKAALQSEQVPHSFYAKLRFYQTLAAYYYSIDDKEEEFECNSKMLGLIEQNDYFKRDHTLDYVTIFSRYLILTKSVKPNTYKDTLLKFNNIPKLAKGKVRVEALVFTLSNSTEMTRMIKENELEEALRFIPEVERGMKKYGAYVNEPFKMAMHYRFAYVHLALGHYSEALTQLNRLLDTFQEEVRPDIFRFAKLLTLVVHFELGNDTLLPYFSQSFALYLKKRNVLFKTELILVKYLKKLVKIPQGENRSTTFLAFKAQLEDVLADPFEENFLAYFDILAWVIGKIQGIPFRDARQEG